MKVAAVIPALNEGTRILAVVADALRFVDKVIVVDDGSNEASRRVYGQFDGDVMVLHHRLNLGKGAALKTGAQKALVLGVDIIVFLDADGQHRPEDIPKLLATLEEKHVDIVFGCRLMNRHMPFMMRLGNRFLSLVTSALFRVYVSDTQSGFRAFRRSAYPSLEWESPRYAAETEMIANVGKQRIPYTEVEIQTIYHDKYKGTTVFDGIRIFFNIILWRLL